VITVKVQLNQTSQPIIHDNVVNTYQKGAFYCVYTQDEVVFKYPICSIWRVVEKYGFHGRKGTGVFGCPKQP